MTNLPKLISLHDIPSIHAYLMRIGAEARSIRTAVVKEVSGKYWDDVATIYFDGKTGAVTAPHGYEPTEEERKTIEVECGQFIWPEVRLVREWPASALPAKLKEAPPDKVFTFRDLDGNILMKQLRGDEFKGEPKYTPYTLWTDDVIRNLEPDGKLPLWGLDQLKDYSTVFLHEGAKAAKHMADLVEGGTQKIKDDFKKHPWHRDLDEAAHLGWIGGAKNPGRTDWSLLRRLGVTRVYIVSDNDPDGVSAVPEISKQLRCPTYHVQFTQDWPASFDLGDDFPKTLFKTINGVKHYIGDGFRDCLHPATFATDLVTVGKGNKAKEVPVLRQHFKRQWVYVESLDTFVCGDLPDIIRPALIFNKMVRPFSDVASTDALLLKEYDGRTVKLSYKPDAKAGLVTADGASSINVFYPTSVRPAPGDPTPFLDYLKHLIPNEQDRKAVEKWCATLIAKPEVRMEYGLLLMSEKQGIGKNTLGAKILVPLVGSHNTGLPSEHDIVDSAFNSWLARKRYVFVGEIYSGHSWKAYNKLKSYVTDKEVEIHEKYMRPYRDENWCHFCVCSNAILALKIEEDDRRWLIPPVTEVKWPKENFKALYDWIASGGLSIIMHWAETYGDYVEPGERAPMTARKKKAINDSLTDEERELKDICELGIEAGESFAVSSKLVLSVVKQKTRGPLHLTAHELGKAMERGGMLKHEGMVKIDGGLHILFLSPVARDQIVALGGDTAAVNALLRTLEGDGRPKVQRM